MKDLFKLKPEARQFFPEWGADVKDLEFWQTRDVNMRLLDKCSNVYVMQGKETGPNTRHLGGFDSREELAHFQFTIYFRGIDIRTYNNIDNGKLLDTIQKAVDLAIDEIL